MTTALVILLGALIEAAVGWPPRLFARIGHPVTWMGHLIRWLESRLNASGDTARLLGGLGTTAIVLAVSMGIAGAVQATLPEGMAGVAIGAVVAWPFLATRSMFEHVRAVLRPLSAGDEAEARSAVAMIVGRDPAMLDGSGIARASIESLAENTSDGIVAPVFWGVVAGLPGLVGYKAINTMDSMIGHRSETYERFGKVAARLDDVVNWIPARLTGLLFAAAAGRHAARSLAVMRRDASKHRSPNAGWPESAVAGALGIRLSGPRIYHDAVADEPWLNAEGRDPGADDLGLAISLFWRAMGLMALALLALALI